RVECEPARPCGRRAVGIDGDHLEEAALAELEQAVVRAHRDVFAAALRAHTQQRFEMILALLECGRRDDQVVECGANHRLPQAPAAVSSAAKSISTRAPLGSKKKTCHT